MKEREVGENMTVIIVAFLFLLSVMVIAETIRDSRQVSFDLEIGGAVEGISLDGKSVIKLPLNVTVDGASLNGKVHVSAPYVLWKNMQNEMNAAED